MSETRVKEFYSSMVRSEWRRLVKDAYHRLELETTLFFLEKYLPPQGRVNGVLEGNIIDLSRFGDGTFDAVVCLDGPLSHVLDAQHRERAAGELVRVLKPGGRLFVSVMGRMSVLELELVRFQDEIEMSHFTQIRDTGDYAGEHGFTACHFFLPEELQALFQAQGARILEMAGLEGMATHHRRKVNQLAKVENRWKTWRQTHFQTCTHPAVVGTSEHMLVVCTKEGARRDAVITENLGG